MVSFLSARLFLYRPVGFPVYPGAVYLAPFFVNKIISFAYQKKKHMYLILGPLRALNALARRGVLSIKYLFCIYSFSFLFCIYIYIHRERDRGRERERERDV